MRKLMLLSILPILLTSCGGNSNVPKGYKLFFEDQFDEESLDTSIWSYEIGNGNNGWGNSEIEYYQKDNAVVKDGSLHIIARKESVQGFNYTSARIKTVNNMKFKYGIVEARISLPVGKGLWPAFWMMPNDSIYGGWPHSGEIDIMEANGASEYGTSCAIHYSIPGGTHTYDTGYNNMNTRTYKSSISEFHIYKLDWQEDSIKVYVDDRLIKEFPSRSWSTASVTKSENPLAPFDQEFYVIFNLAISGNYVKGDEPPRDFESAEMVIDYLRVYTYLEGE